MLLEFNPQALQAFPNLTHKTALAVLGADPPTTQGRALTVKRIVALLPRVGRRSDPRLADPIRDTLQLPSFAPGELVARGWELTSPPKN